VDTFTADFMPIIPGSVTAALPSGSPRLGPQASSGQVTFSRFTAAAVSRFIPVGTTVQTGDGTANFVVTADPAFANWTASPAPGGYTMASLVASILAPVKCQVAGSIGNVQAGAISSITSAVPGVDLVNNIAAYTNGFDKESDSALKKRFSDYILGLSRGDIYGLSASIEGTAVEVQWTLTEGYNLDGTYHPGYFFVVADDGSGAPTPAFLATVDAAVQAVRPLGVQGSTFPPTIVVANIALQITTAPGFVHNDVEALVAALIATNINSLGLGNPLPWSIIASWAYSVPGVTVVSNVLVNGNTGDGASIGTFKLTVDGTYRINYITIKCGSVNIS
jgi:uncharacterized phage protein gp47/JayE